MLSFCGEEKIRRLAFYFPLVSTSVYVSMSNEEKHAHTRKKKQVRVQNIYTNSHK